MSDELLSSNLNAAITINKLKQELETTKRLLDDSINFHFLINELDILGSDNQGKMAAASRSFLRLIGKFE